MPNRTMKPLIAINRVTRPSKPTLVQVLRPVEPLIEVCMETARPHLSVVDGRLVMVREIS
jgi:hypothetical protein